VPVTYNLNPALAEALHDKYNKCADLLIAAGADIASVTYSRLIDIQRGKTDTAAFLDILRDLDQYLEDRPEELSEIYKRIYAYAKKYGAPANWDYQQVVADTVRDILRDRFHLVWPPEPVITPQEQYKAALEKSITGRAMGEVCQRTVALEELLAQEPVRLRSALQKAFQKATWEKNHEAALFLLERISLLPVLTPERT
jgi:hypothetical protein